MSRCSKVDGFPQVERWLQRRGPRRLLGFGQRPLLDLLILSYP